jgi:hypothetical protein
MQRTDVVVYGNAPAAVHGSQMTVRKADKLRLRFRGCRLRLEGESASGGRETDELTTAGAMSYKVFGLHSYNSCELPSQI